jgi:hypothetical protein
MSESEDSFVSQKKRISPSDQPVVRTNVQSELDSNKGAARGNLGFRPWFSFLTRRPFIVPLVLACVVLFAHYVRVADYGFYEDDYWGIVPWFKTPPTELWEDTISYFETWPTGRPLNHALPPWFSWLGYHLAGVQGIYFLGFLIHSLNAFLIYLLLRRWLGHWAAALAGFLLVLLPVDTTRILLIHNAHIHTSLTFLLVALLINRTRYWIASYPIAALSLLSYETAFLPFIVFPLFFVERGKRIVRWLIHLAGSSTVLLIVFGIRLSLAEERVKSAMSGPAETLWRMLSSMWIGPESDLKIIAKAIFKAPHAQAPFAFLFAGLAALLLVLLLRFINEPPLPGNAADRRRYLAVFLGGLVSWIFAYALTLTNYPPTQETGRLTSTHVAAVFGLACAMAAATTYLRSLNRPARIAVTAAVTMLVPLLALYSFRVQGGFAIAWQQERQFWKHVVNLCPDITPKTRIFLTGTEPKQNEFILTNSWADPLVLENVFTTTDTSDVPLLFYFDGMARFADIRSENGQVTWKPFFWGTEREVLDRDHVIILRDDGTTITRINELQIPGIPFPIQGKPVATPQEPLYPAKLTSFGRFLLQQP